VQIVIILGKSNFFLDIFSKFLHSNITKEHHRRFGWLLPQTFVGVTRVQSQEGFPMHDFLIALVFVAMVTSPAIVASVPRSKHDDR